MRIHEAGVMRITVTEGEVEACYAGQPVPLEELGKIHILNALASMHNATQQAKADASNSILFIVCFQALKTWGVNQLISAIAYAYEAGKKDPMREINY